VSLLVVLATYVSLGRLLTANLSVYQEAILQELNVRLPFTVEAETVSGSWSSFSPYIVLRGLQLTFPGNATPPISLSEGRMGVHVLNTLRTGTLQVTRVELTNLQLSGELSSERGFQLQGFGGGGGEVGAWLQEFLLNVESIALRKNGLSLRLPGGDVRDLSLDLLLAREGSYRRLDAKLVSTAGSRFTVLAEGTGDPFRPGQFIGEGYVDAQSTDLGAMRQLLGENGPSIWVEGAGELELWLQWQRGDPLVEVHLDARDIKVAAVDGTWEVPLERLAGQAQLEKTRHHRRVYASEVVLERGGVALKLPALQLDGGGNAMRLLARDIPMGSAVSLFGQMEAAPENLRDVFAALAPRGQIDLLELRIDDVREPASGWEAAATFSEVAVEPYSGAPGVTGASGYTRFTQSGGEVIVDSEAVSLAFPKIYHEPLTYEELYGTLTVDWDEQALRLGSGLLTVRAPEGEAKLLFGLQIPFEPTPEGLEMDLFVGLQNFHLDIREKYLPYTLPDTLLNWLEGSIGDGLVREGAFLWRGSLPPVAPEMRTVQLAFNASDTAVNYDDRWPPVTLDDGTILIDDTDVSVWASRATLFDSNAYDISVETVVNASKHTVLSLRAGMQGPARDGLRILNETALTDLVGGAFGEWTAEGDLATQLNLQLELTQIPAPPLVEVQVALQGVDLQIVPGNVPLSAVSGGFNYSTQTGFSSADLKCGLWGDAINARVSQHHAPGTSRYVAGSSAVHINFDTRAEMSELRSWLKLDFLRMAEGATDVNGSIRLLPGQAPTLHIDSDLKGVSIDLPHPWTKLSSESRQLAYVMPLSSDPDLLALQLGLDLKLHLSLQGGLFRGGTLGVNVEPAAIEEGQLLVTGHAPLIEADQWMDFATEYFFPPPEDDGTTSGAVSPVSDDLDTSDPGTAATRLHISQFNADLVHVFDQSVRDASFSLDFKQHRWELALETDWLRGTGFLSRDGTASGVTAQYLDIGKLSELGLLSDKPVELAAAPKNTPLPDFSIVQIELENLHRGERRLGELSFNLQAQAGVLTAQEIGGSFAGMRFDDTAQNTLTWSQGEQSSTEFDAGMLLEDMGATLEFFGYQRTIESREGALALNMTWPDTPANFSLSQGEGSVQLHLGKGNFHQAPASASGALRVVSILNLTDIVRRLSLTHMFESGIPFDSVDGEIKLANGVIAVPRLYVGGGSSFLFKGRSNIEQRSLKGELVATLPVASNLPWIAALTASLPIAAGVFVISKIFDKQMSRLSSLVYSIGGTWDEPQISFNRVFDNNADDGTVDDDVASQPSQVPTEPVNPEAIPDAPGSVLEGAAAVVPVEGGVSVSAQDAVLDEPMDVAPEAAIPPETVAP
jgi:uncharacterized protein (TIGR02099 family)